MKKILMLLACASLLFACNDKDREYNDGHEPKFINVELVSTDYSPFAATSTLTYSCPEAVTGASNQAWCTVSKTREGEMKVTVAENKTVDTRNAMVTLRAKNGQTVRIPVTQRGLVCRASESKTYISAIGGTSQLELYTPLYELSTQQDWIDYSVDGSTLTITLEYNPLNEARTGSIEIEVPEYGFSSSIVVEQPAIVFTATPSTVTLPNAGGKQIVVVSAPVDFTVTPSEDWINYSVEGENLILEVGESPTSAARSGTVELEIPAYSLKRTITVRQSAEIRGLGMAQKFIGPGGSVQTQWYLDTASENGADFNGAFNSATLDTPNYKYEYVKFGYINTKAGAAGSNLAAGYRQVVWVRILYKPSSTIFELGYLVEMVEGDTDDQVVVTLKYDRNQTQAMWSNDHYFFDRGIGPFLTNLTGGAVNSKKTYAITSVDDVNNPTEMILTEVDNPNNYFTVSKAVVWL